MGEINNVIFFSVSKSFVFIWKKKISSNRNGDSRSSRGSSSVDIFIRSSIQHLLLCSANMSCVERSVFKPHLVERSSLHQGVRRKINQGGTTFRSQTSVQRHTPSCYRFWLHRGRFLEVDSMCSAWRRRREAHFFA